MKLVDYDNLPKKVKDVFKSVIIQEINKERKNMGLSDLESKYVESDVKDKIDLFYVIIESIGGRYDLLQKICRTYNMNK